MAGASISELAKSGDPLLRSQAFEDLCQLPMDAAGFSLLLQLAQDPSPEIASVAAEAIADICNSSSKLDQTQAQRLAELLGRWAGKEQLEVACTQSQAPEADLLMVRCAALTAVYRSYPLLSVRQYRAWQDEVIRPALIHLFLGHLRDEVGGFTPFNLVLWELDEPAAFLEFLSAVDEHLSYLSAPRLLETVRTFWQHPLSAPERPLHLALLAMLARHRVLIVQSAAAAEARGEREPWDLSAILKSLPTAERQGGPSPK